MNYASYSSGAFRTFSIVFVFLCVIFLLPMVSRAELSLEDFNERLGNATEKGGSNMIPTFIKIITENPDTASEYAKILREHAVGENKTGNINVAVLVEGILNMLKTRRYNTESLVEEYLKAENLFYEGQKKSDISDYRGANQRWEAALTIYQKFGIKMSIGAALASLGTAYDDLSDYQKAIGYLEKAIVIFDEIGEIKSKETATGNLGSAYVGLSDYRKAINYYDKALVIAKEISDKQGMGEQLGNIGSAYADLGNYHKAKDYHEKALVIFEEIGDNIGKQKGIGNLGQDYYVMGDYRKALEYYEKALVFIEDSGNKKDKATLIGSLGDVYDSLGDYRKTIDYYEKSMALMEEVGDKGSVGLYFGRLGVTYIKLGDYHKAIDYLEKALAIFDMIGTKHGKAVILGNLGVVYSNSGDYTTAIDYFQKAIVIEKEIDVPYDVTEGNLGDTYLALNRDKEALSIYTKLYEPNRLGRYYLKKKDFKEATKKFAWGIERSEKTKQAEPLISLWIGYGLSFEGLWEYETAYKWYTKAVDFLEDQRAALSPSEREHFFEGKESGFPRIDAYEGAARCAFMLNRLDDAFYWAENTRGRIFSELISGKQSKANYKIPKKLALEEEDLIMRIASNKKQQQIAFEKNNTELLKQLEQEYPALKQRMDNLIDRLRKQYPQYAGARYPQPVKLNQLAIKKGETIIEYEVTDPYTIGLVIKHGNVVKGFKVEKTRAELATLIARFRAPFQEEAYSGGFSPNLRHNNLAKELAELLLTPALSSVQKGDHLTIIPDETLNLLPFESLLISTPEAVLEEEATLLAKARGGKDTGMVNRQVIIRGLTTSPATSTHSIKIAPSVSTHIVFDTGADTIKPESNKQLVEIATALMSNELKGTAIRIVGHTDNVGEAAYNQKLSVKRATAVYQYLVKNGGIPKSRLSVTGKGDTEPIADNKDESGRQINRRVDFVRIDKQEDIQTKNDQPSTKDIVYAIDEYPISYYPSASVLSQRRGLKIIRTQDATIFALGDPVFDTEDDRSSELRNNINVSAKPTKTEFSSRNIAENQETKEAGYHFPRLENTGKEVEEVGKLFDRNKVLIGINASEENVKAQDLSSRRYVLFSTHGILGNEIPYIKQPALVLNLVGNVNEDGFLTASEIFGLNLNADLVV
ncbi:MAG: tetratricopeptide repeat protein, partial [Nitrospirae bacterium]|nr:tetratricopeptide repeat protein [Nitrospirota bacterium]